MHTGLLLSVPALLKTAPSALPLRVSSLTVRASPRLLGGDAADAAELAALLEGISTSVRAFEAEEMATRASADASSWVSVAEPGAVLAATAAVVVVGAMFSAAQQRSKPLPARTVVAVQDPSKGASSPAGRPGSPVTSSALLLLGALFGFGISGIVSANVNTAASSQPTTNGLASLVLASPLAPATTSVALQDNFLSSVPHETIACAAVLAILVGAAKLAGSSTDPEPDAVYAEHDVDLSEGSVAVSSADGVFTALAANVSEWPVALATADFDTIYFAVPDATAVADVGAAAEAPSFAALAAVDAAEIAELRSQLLVAEGLEERAREAEARAATLAHELAYVRASLKQARDDARRAEQRAAAVEQAHASVSELCRALGVAILVASQRRAASAREVLTSQLAPAAVISIECARRVRVALEAVPEAALSTLSMTGVHARSLAIDPSSTALQLQRAAVLHTALLRAQFLAIARELSSSVPSLLANVTAAAAPAAVVALQRANAALERSVSVAHVASGLATSRVALLVEDAEVAAQQLRRAAKKQATKTRRLLRVYMAVVRARGQMAAEQLAVEAPLPPELKGLVARLVASLGAVSSTVSSRLAALGSTELSPPRLPRLASVSRATLLLPPSLHLPSFAPLLSLPALRAMPGALGSSRALAVAAAARCLHLCAEMLERACRHVFGRATSAGRAVSDASEEVAYALAVALLVVTDELPRAITQSATSARRWLMPVPAPNS
jgi:hypothetical protein